MAQAAGVSNGRSSIEEFMYDSWRGVDFPSSRSVTAQTLWHHSVMKEIKNVTELKRIAQASGSLAISAKDIFRLCGAVEHKYGRTVEELQRNEEVLKEIIDAKVDVSESWKYENTGQVGWHQTCIDVLFRNGATMIFVINELAGHMNPMKAKNVLCNATARYDKKFWDAASSVMEIPTDIPFARKPEPLFIDADYIENPIVPRQKLDIGGSKRSGVITDDGYPNNKGSPMRGWYDLRNQGVSNDYVRYVGDHPNIRLCVAMSGDTTEFSHYFSSMDEFIRMLNGAPFEPYTKMS